MLNNRPFNAAGSHKKGKFMKIYLNLVNQVITDKLMT